MARKVTVSLTDDLDSELTADETVEFGLDGAAFEIDLASSNAEKLREVLQPWITASRRVSGRARGRRPISVNRDAGSGLTSGELAELRAWANANNVKVASRGRVSASVVAQFQKAKAAPQVKRVNSRKKAEPAEVKSDAVEFSE